MSIYIAHRRRKTSNAQKRGRVSRSCHARGWRN